MHTLVLPCAPATASTDLGILLSETFANLFDLNDVIELTCPGQNSQTQQVLHTQQRSLALPPQTLPAHTHKGYKIKRDFAVLRRKQKQLF